MATNAWGIWTIVDKPNSLNNDFMLLVKTATKPAIYGIRGNKRIMIIDMPTLTSFMDPFKVISDEEMAKYEDGGTWIWTERVIQ